MVILITSKLRYNSQIEEFVATIILVDRLTPPKAIAIAAQKFPQATGLDLIFALVSLAQSVQQWHPKDPFEREMPALLYKCCAVLGADLFALEKLGTSPAFCGDLTDYWGEADPYFK